MKHPYWTDLDGNKRSRCPRRPVYENPEFFNKVLAAHASYSAGFLPRAGGMHDQHCNFPTIMSIVEGAVAECNEANRNTSNRQAKLENDGKVSLLSGG